MRRIFKLLANEKQINIYLFFSGAFKLTGDILRAEGKFKFRFYKFSLKFDSKTF